MTSIREEDIFNINERNRNYYIECEIPDICGENCCCYYNQLIYPNSIGNNDFKRKLNNKMYIWSQETCIICMEKIKIKTDAYLTDCGHSFHKHCITHYYHYIKMISNKPLKCPMCRSNLGHPVFNEKYNIIHKDANFIDVLENINMNSIKVEMLHICKFQTSELCGYHYLGMNSLCSLCLDYRKTGFIK